MVIEIVQDKDTCLASPDDEVNKLWLKYRNTIPVSSVPNPFSGCDPSESVSDSERSTLEYADPGKSLFQSRPVCLDPNSGLELPKSISANTKSQGLQLLITNCRSVSLISNHISRFEESLCGIE